MQDTTDRRLTGHARTVLARAAALVAAAVCAHWAWNTVGAGLFAWPRFDFVHSLAALLGLAAAGAAAGFGLAFGARAGRG